MIRLIVRFANWLNTRFPEKFTVTMSDWNRRGYEVDKAHEEIDILRGDLNELKANHAATIDRVSRLEAHSAHVDAVKEVIKHVGELKAELVSLKANLGWSNRGAKTAEIEAMLNGEPINHGE